MSFLITDNDTRATAVATSSSSPAVDGNVNVKSALLIASALILVLSLISGIVGNVLVCLSVYRNRSLRNANNALLVNLAVADLVVCFTGIPVMLAEVINGYGPQCLPFGEVLCLAQTFFHVSSSSVQLTTLVAVSVERYEAIVHPFETKKKRRRVIFGISVSWVLALLIAIPAAALLRRSSMYLLCTCRLSDQPVDYVHVVIIAPLGITCLLFVVIFYLKIFRTVRQHVKEKHKSKVENPVVIKPTTRTFWAELRCASWCRTNTVGVASEGPLRPGAEFSPPAQEAADKSSAGGIHSGSKPNNHDTRNNESDRTDLGSSGPLVRHRVECTVDGSEPGAGAGSSITPDTGVGSYGAAHEPNDGEQDHTKRSSPVKVAETPGAPDRTRGLLVAVIPATPTDLGATPQRMNAASPSPSCQPNARTPGETSRGASHHNNDIQGSVCVLNPAMRVRGRRNLEAKTAKRASYIIGVFGLCWLPLFVTSYVRTCVEVDILVACVAAMSAALNPVVYTVVNKSFRKEFVKMLREFTRCCPARCKWFHKP